MSDPAWLLAYEPDSIDDVELPSGDIAVEETVEPSSVSDYLEGAFDQDTTPAPANDEWNQMRVTADGQQFGPELNNRNVHYGPVGVIYQQFGAANVLGSQSW